MVPKRKSALIALLSAVAMCLGVTFVLASNASAANILANPGFEAADLQAEYPEWRQPHSDRYLQLLPHRDGTDGFFIARLKRL